MQTLRHMIRIGLGLVELLERNFVGTKSVGTACFSRPGSSPVIKAAHDECQLSSCQQSALHE